MNTSAHQDSSPAEPVETEFDAKVSCLTALPLEIQLMILQHTPYPDSLALKITSKHFRDLVAPTHTVAKRVTWLLERADIALNIPTVGKLKLNTDELFLKSQEVQSILLKRRMHRECVEAWEKDIRMDSKSSRHVFRGCLVRMNGEKCVAIRRAMNKADKARHEYIHDTRRRWYQLDQSQFEYVYNIHHMTAMITATAVALGCSTKYLSYTDLWSDSFITDKALILCCAMVIMFWGLALPQLIIWERRLRSRWRSQDTWHLVELH